MTEEQSLSWVKKVEEVVRHLEEKPQFGFPFSCDWPQLEHALRELFQRPSLSLSHQVKGWIPPETQKEGLGKILFPLAILWTPLGHPAYFVTSQDDLTLLMADLFGGSRAAAYFSDPSLIQGFYTYLAAEILHTLEQTKCAYPLVPRLGSADSLDATLFQAPTFVIDLSCAFESYTFRGRLFLTEAFRNEWKSYFSHFPPPPLSPSLQEKLSVELSVEVGKSQLSLQEWKKVAIGDCVLLDSALYDPSTTRRSVLLTLHHQPLWRGRLKEGVIKLIEPVTYEEVDAPMNETPSFDSGLDQEDEDIPPLSGPEGETSSGKAPSLDVESVPIQLTVEVGRLRMSVKELMALAPGNLLELSHSPEQGVDLLLNGRKVGRGELVRVGDALGVRIVSL